MYKKKKKEQQLFKTNEHVTSLQHCNSRIQEKKKNNLKIATSKNCLLKPSSPQQETKRKILQHPP